MILEQQRQLREEEERLKREEEEEQRRIEEAIRAKEEKVSRYSGLWLLGDVASDRFQSYITTRLEIIYPNMLKFILM